MPHALGRRRCSHARCSGCKLLFFMSLCSIEETIHGMHCAAALVGRHLERASQPLTFGKSSRSPHSSLARLLPQHPRLARPLRLARHRSALSMLPWLWRIVVALAPETHGIFAPRLSCAFGARWIRWCFMWGPGGFFIIKNPPGPHFAFHVADREGC
jgi:hypothetical protein